VINEWFVCFVLYQIQVLKMFFFLLFLAVFISGEKLRTLGITTVIQKLMKKGSK